MTLGIENKVGSYLKVQIIITQSVPTFSFGWLWNRLKKNFISALFVKSTSWLTFLDMEMVTLPERQVALVNMFRYLQTKNKNFIVYRAGHCRTTKWAIPELFEAGAGVLFSDFGWAYNTYDYLLVALDY